MSSHGERGEEALRAVFYKGINYVCDVKTSQSPQFLIPQGLRIQYMNLGGELHTFILWQLCIKTGSEDIPKT